MSQRERLVTLLPKPTLRALWAEADERDMAVGRLLDRIIRQVLPELARERTSGVSNPNATTTRRNATSGRSSEVPR